MLQATDFVSTFLLLESTEGLHLMGERRFAFLMPVAQRKPLGEEIGLSAWGEICKLFGPCKFYGEYCEQLPIAAVRMNPAPTNGNYEVHVRCLFIPLISPPAVSVAFYL